MEIKCARREEAYKEGARKKEEEMTKEMFNRDRKWGKRVEDEWNCRGPRKRCCDVERSPERSPERSTR
jgi:hypothetical protein